MEKKDQTLPFPFNNIVELIKVPFLLNNSKDEILLARGKDKAVEGVGAELHVTNSRDFETSPSPPDKGKSRD